MCEIPARIMFSTDNMGGNTEYIRLLTVAIFCSKQDTVQMFRSTMHFHILMLLASLGTALVLPAAEVVSYI